MYKCGFPVWSPPVWPRFPPRLWLRSAWFRFPPRLWLPPAWFRFPPRLCFPPVCPRCLALLRLTTWFRFPAFLRLPVSWTGLSRAGFPNRFRIPDGPLPPCF